VRDRVEAWKASRPRAAGTEGDRVWGGGVPSPVEVGSLVHLPRIFWIFCVEIMHLPFWYTFDVKNELRSHNVRNNVNSVFANDKYVIVAVDAMESGLWSLERVDGDSATGAVLEALVWSTALGLHGAHGCQQSTRSRRPHIDSTSFRQVVCGKFRRGGRTPAPFL